MWTTQGDKILNLNYIQRIKVKHTTYQELRKLKEIVLEEGKTISRLITSYYYDVNHMLQRVKWLSFFYIIILDT